MMTRKKKFIVVLIVLGVLVGAYLKFRNPINVAETNLTTEDLPLRTRIYRVKGGHAEAKKIVEQIVPTLTTYQSAWRIVSHDNNPKAKLEAKNVGKESFVKAEVPVVFFTDDLQIRLSEGSTPDEVVVDVKSASRVGKSDFWENRRHIVQLLTALDEKFGASNSK
jgi:hypothetical protein